MVKIQVKKLRFDAKIPKYANSGDAGMDIFSNEEFILLPKHRKAISTGISMSFPKEYVALVWDKSGIANSGIKTMAGVIDSSYRGEYKIVLINLSSKPHIIKKGQKIAQILIQKVEFGKIIEVKDLGETNRGKEGFGSTGLF